eukprot:15431422-Alexandrium_andersonii.AAC.1
MVLRVLSAVGARYCSFSKDGASLVRVPAYLCAHLRAACRCAFVAGVARRKSLGVPVMLFGSE